MATHASQQQDFAEFRKAAVRNSTAHSRSTSAGSAPSDGQRSIDLQRLLQDSPASTVAYPQDTLGLPEYEYPAPWTLPQTPQLPETNLGAPPLIVKNTFLGFGPFRSPSFDEFYEERLTQSCPASGIGLPPGLEDMFEPEETRAKLIQVEAALQRTSLIEAAGVENVDWPTEHLLPSGLLDLATELEPHQTFSPFQSQASDCGFSWQTPMPMVPPASLNAPQQPMVLDLQAALGSAAPAQQPAVSAELGSLDFPTIGSQGHWYGACRPCAFLYTKGCGNGVSCEFCHLCDAGEKKRRAKDKRAAFRAGRNNCY